MSGDWQAVGDVHTVPIDDLVDHDQTRTCWCGPRFRAPCPEDCDTGCWRCGHDRIGMVDVGADHDGSVNVVHNAADGRE